MSSHIARKVVRQFRQNDPGPAKDETEGLAPPRTGSAPCWPPALCTEIADQLGISRKP
jgi:hypothetical protein